MPRQGASTKLDSQPIAIEDISIVIPVKNNQKGIETFLGSFFKTHPPSHFPSEILIVDNNSTPPIKNPDIYLGKGIEIRLLICKRSGPAAARNEGAKHASGDWLLFIDSDCIPTASSIRGFLHLSKHSSAYIGAVGVLGKDLISQYYFSQKIHRSPEKVDKQGSIIPKYLITANFLIRKDVFCELGGFNEFFTFACEDMDFGVRLEQKAPMAFADKAIVLHNYHDGFPGFIRRFYAYGQGNRLIRTLHKLPLFPLPFLPKDKRHWINFGLAGVQWLCLFIGYMVMHVRLLTGNQPRPPKDFLTT